MSSMKLGDRLHKIAVTGLMGFTAVGAITLSFQVFEYFTKVRPARTYPPKGTNQKQAKELSDFSESSMAGISRLSQLFSFIRLQAASNFSRNMSAKQSWNILKVNHLAVATNDLEKSTKFYKDILGAKTSEVVSMPEHGVHTVFVELDNTKIELLLPLGEKSPIANFLEKNPSGGMHHICLEVDNIENAVKDLKAKNVRLLSDTTKIGAHGKPVIFLHPKDCGGVLVELEQV